MEVVVFHQLGVGKMVGMQGAVLVAGKMVGVEIAGLAQKAVVADETVGVDVAVLAQKDVVADQMAGVEGALVLDQMVGVLASLWRWASPPWLCWLWRVLVVLASLWRWAASSMEEPLSAPDTAHHTAHQQVHTALQTRFCSPHGSSAGPHGSIPASLDGGTAPAFDASYHQTRFCSSASYSQNQDPP